MGAKCKAGSDFYGVAEMNMDLLAQSVGLGGYISIWKVAIFTSLFIFWAWAGSWIDKDAEKVHTRRDFWNILYLVRSEEHTSELQSHSFISYAVFCLKKKK